MKKSHSTKFVDKTLNVIDSDPKLLNDLGKKFNFDRKQI